jgi:hypothetical protein
MSTIIGGNADRPDNIHTFDTITNTGTSPAIEIDGSRITTFEKVVGGQITYEFQGSHNGTDWAPLDEAKTKEIGNHIHVYNGYLVRYVRLDVTSSGATRSITLSVCCDS